MKNLVTIVIPCKNEELYIGNLLYDLAMSHGMVDVKIIIADANSTDKTRHIINYWKQFLNITLIEGGPVSVARNNGAKLCTTPYILFLDADTRLFNHHAIYDSVTEMHEKNLDLITLNVKNYGKDIRATFLFKCFNVINKIMTIKTPFAIGAFFLTRRETFERFGGFPYKYETSEDYILSKQYNPKKFKIVNHYFGQDERRFKKLGYLGMLKYMIVNFFNRNNLKHFEKAKVNYWD
jgi:glycosyltransferase involved in cell wall biosynthesis